MSLLESFKSQFIARHDFEDSDIDVFLNRWKNKTIFKDIPLAWIIILDTMMFELNKRNYIVKSVIQQYGQLIVSISANADASNSFLIIESAKKKIEEIDKDLYSLFDINTREEFYNKIYKFKDKIYKFCIEETN